MIASISIYRFAENPVPAKPKSLVDMPGACVNLEDVEPKAMCPIFVECVFGDRFEKLSSEALVRRANHNTPELERFVLGLKPEKN